MSLLLVSGIVSHWLAVFELRVDLHTETYQAPGGPKPHGCRSVAATLRPRTPGKTKKASVVVAECRYVDVVP